MQTNQFIAALTGNGGAPSHPVAPKDEPRAHTAALQILEDL